ncbi:mammalian cell entry protein [Mycobacteroides saopaulense]|uniref:MlaD family protein n=1 Tax=Mycobacteroides saopaulense TaxID=1578165 RepID=UPI0007216DBC|nr:MCE family protein [Mycobacteroides saopaulense]ALR10746.1 mammalian cell entry protein [Mycobacteroides saopaulense]
MRNSWRTLMAVTSVIALSIVLGLVIVTALRSPVEGSLRHYSANFSDASGLFTGNDVRISGVQVGKVDRVSLDGDSARVDFSVQSDRPIYTETIVAIRYQSLLGQRYVELAQPAVRGEELAAGANIPVGQTIPSFDVAKLFNGFKPIFQTLDPAQFNRFGENLLRLIQGDDDGIGPVLRDVDAIMKVAVNRRAALVTIIHNLSQVAQELGGTSQQLVYLINSLSDVLGTFAEKADDFNTAVTTALPLLRNLNNMLGYAERTIDGANMPVFDIMSRMFPQTPTVMAGISLLPDLIQGMRDSLIEDKPVTPSFKCSNGVATLPGIGEISFAEQNLVICK